MKTSIFELLNKTQEDLRKYLICKLEREGYKNRMYYTDEFIYARGNIPVLLVAHLDTVHKDLPEIYFDKKKRSNLVATRDWRR